MSTSKLTARRNQFTTWDEVQEYYLQQGLTDGLPIVPPTEEKVRAMLEYAGLAPDEVVSTETIRQKRFTAAKVAINAVMAGCKPEYFPVVVAAVAAVCERSFNFHASSTSTNGVTVLVLVSGPYASQIGMNAGVELMGNGNRANATIGRAVNLVKTNFYGSVPGDMDNSTFGHPGKFSFCFAENLDVSPWPSLTAAKGFGDNASTVTVFAANSPLQVSIYGGKDPEKFLMATAQGMLGLGPSQSEILVVISPEVMAYVAEAGWSRQQVQEFLYEKTRRPACEWIAWNRIDHPDPNADLERLIGCVAEPERITVVPGGGAAGAFIDIISSWGSSRSVTREVQIRSKQP
jgi:hypothetical protein